jgi:hypothetical protein
MIWIKASILVLFGTFLVISIPSIFLLFKMGYKEYFKRINFLYYGYKNIKNCYSINKKTNYIDQFSKTWTKNDIYYYTTIISDNKINVIEFNEYIYNFDVTQYLKNKEGGWTPSEYRVNHNSCIFTSILFMLFLKKIDKLKNNSTLVNNMEELNNIINSDIKKITRENKLRKILSN